MTEVEIILLLLINKFIVAILLKEAADFEKPSDIQGLIYIPFQNKVDEVSISLIRELSRQGYKIDTARI